MRTWSGSGGWAYCRIECVGCGGGWQVRTTRNGSGETKAPSLDHYRCRHSATSEDIGRFVRDVTVSHVTLTCEDQTTIEFGFGFGFARTMVPITDGAFSFDDVFWESAFHIAGDLGPLHGQGTLSKAQAVITPDEQAAQLCTTGDLSWAVEFVRIL